MSKNQKEKIKRLIDRFIKGLISSKMNLDEGERILEELQYLADDAIPSVVEILASSNEEERLAAIILLRELGDPRAVNPLQRMLREPNYSDGEKMQVIQTLDVLGATIDEETFRRAISDPEALLQASMEQMLATIEDPAQVEAVLEMMKEAPPEMAESYVRDILAPLDDRR